MFRFSDGFDHYAPTTALAADITTYLQAAGYTINNATNGTFNIVNGTDVGSKGLKFTVAAGSGTPPSLSRAITSNATLVAFGFGFRGTVGRLRFARINGVVDIDWDVATGKMKVGEVLGADVIIMNAWYYIEVEIDKTANVVRVWANDTLQITAALPGGVGTTHTVTWGMTATSPTGGVIELDDFYIVDNDGGQVAARIGPIAVVTRAPTADVTKDWTIVGQAATTHFTVAAQLEPGKTGAPYLQANIAGKTDTFTSNTVLPNDNQVFAVSLVSYARKGDLDARSLGLSMGTAGGTEEVQIALTEAYKFHQAVFELAPGGVAWNQNRVETSMFGLVAR